MKVSKSLVVLLAALMAMGPLCHELTKLSGMIDHYVHHVKVHNEAELSVVEYLLKHFGGTGHDDEHHQNLPMHGSMTHPNTNLQLGDVDSSEPEYFLPVKYSEMISEPVTTIPLAPSKSVFQPPKS